MSEIKKILSTFRIGDLKRCRISTKIGECERPISSVSNKSRLSSKKISRIPQDAALAGSIFARRFLARTHRRHGTQTFPVGAKEIASLLSPDTEQPAKFDVEQPSSLKLRENTGSSVADETKPKRTNRIKLARFDSPRRETQIAECRKKNSGGLKAGEHREECWRKQKRYQLARSQRAGGLGTGTENEERICCRVRHSQAQSDA